MKKILENIINMDDREYARFTILVQLLVLAVFAYGFFSVRAIIELRSIALEQNAYIRSECAPNLDLFDALHELENDKPFEFSVK